MAEYTQRLRCSSLSLLFDCQSASVHSHLDKDVCCSLQAQQDITHTSVQDLYGPPHRCTYL
ncbi:hypothetical protein BaRGS_00018739, partial [Batillaria attramentaria]